MTYEQLTIQKNTRDGRVLWSHVAAQLGMSEPTARAQFDMTYQRPYSPATLPKAAPPPPKLPRGTFPIPNLEQDIMRAAGKGPTPLWVIVDSVKASRGTVTRHLAKLREEGMMIHYPDRAGWGVKS